MKVSGLKILISDHGGFWVKSASLPLDMSLGSYDLINGEGDWMDLWMHINKS